MEVIAGISLSIISVNLLVWLLCLLLFPSRGVRKSIRAERTKLPRMAVLLAARNEEANLAACLEHLLRQDYPAESLHIWLGDDASTDATFSIAQQYAQAYPQQISLVSIQQMIGKARGKANVLAQLARLAEDWADYFCITDADVRVPPGWVRTLADEADTQIGTLSAATVIDSADAWGTMQAMDWLLALAMAKTYAELPGIGKPATAIGNNMLIPVAVYRQTGGYEQIPFSITEDLELLRQTEKLGYKSRLIARPETRALSLPAPDWRSLLHQRKRWMSGALRLPPFMVLVLFLQAFFYPAILVALWHLGVMALLLWGLKLAMQLLLMRRFAGLLEAPKPWLRCAILYELYALALHVCLLVFYLLPVKIQWKGRAYKKNSG